MQPLAWDPAWEMGDPRLERQHQSMVGAINRLGAAIEAGEAQGEARRAISFLLVYMATHFKDEEALMEGAGYPALEAHRRKHEHCTRKIDDLLELHRTGQPGILAEVVRFFSYWLREHFETADRELAVFLRTPAATFLPARGGDFH